MIVYDLALDALSRPLVAVVDLELLALIVLARDRSTKFAEPLAHRATEFGQALRTEDDQGDDGNDDHFDWSYVWHRKSPLALRDANDRDGHDPRVGTRRQPLPDPVGRQRT